MVLSEFGQERRRLAAQMTVCDPEQPTAESPVPHTYVVTGEEYGSLAEGGSYEVLTCRVCGRVAYNPLPD